MAKVEVSPILADSIKTLRMQKNVSARTIASAIDRSPSYFSKIENGIIKSIDKAELDKIFTVIAGDDRSLDKQIDSLYATLKIKYSAEEIEADIWFLNYDTVQRLIPIPSELISDLNSRIVQAHISIDYLVERINGNDDLPLEYRSNTEYSVNEWHTYGDGSSGEPYIKMFVSVPEIQSILNGATKSSNYVVMLGIAYYLKKIEEYQDKRDLPPDQSRIMMEYAINYLNSYKFYSLTEKQKLLNLATSNEERQRILTSFDRENLNLITEMLEGFQVFSEMNVEFTNKQLSAFIANLHWDSGFMLHIIGAPFSELDKISFTLKQEMLKEIRSIVKKYQEIPEKEKNIEIYT